MIRSLVGLMLAIAVSIGGPASARAQQRSFGAGSLIVPMDLSYQDTGLLQAYGLVFSLLRNGIRVYWLIDPDKTWHSAPCDEAPDLCAWDCEEEGSGDKCPFPTASPDFFAAATVVYDDEGRRAPGTAIANHGYRGGPFVIDAEQRDAAMAIIDEWNDPAAGRAVFEVVSVHEASAAFSGFVAKEMVAAPTIAVFSDGNEDIATSYLRAAGIPQSSGIDFPAAKCGAANCGPGTVNPDMLTVPSIMGDMGTCNAVNYDHENGALFTADGLPAFCQIMSMHWGVDQRERVECDDGRCPAAQADCANQRFTYHGHEVVAEVRAFLQYPVHFFAECQAVNAYENTTPNPDWPYLDDDGRDGHFLTTTGMPPECPTGTCDDGDFECVSGGCAGVDCCLPRDNRELGAGFLISPQPNSSTLQVLHPDVAYNQFDGFFETVGGSEPAYNLSSYLGTEYKNDRDVTFITGPNGPGESDVWMSGFIDGVCQIDPDDDVGPPPAGECNSGKVSYLGGHQYGDQTPVSGSLKSQGARLFLNALFEADCVTSIGQPQLLLGLTGDLVLGAAAVPVDGQFAATYANGGRGSALDAELFELVPAGVEVVSATDGTALVNGASWALGSISGNPPLAGDPPAEGSRGSVLRFNSFGEHQIEVRMRYRVGQSIIEAEPALVTVRVALDSDGDGVPDEDDPEPNDPNLCGDSDADTCDDCANGSFDPNNDGPDADEDGICDAGEVDSGGSGAGGSAEGGCGCRIAPRDPRDRHGLWWLALALVPVLRWRRR